MFPLFVDRLDAGRQLAAALLRYANRPDIVVLGLPRGGVPVAAEVAAALHAPLDALMVRKLGVPGHEELAMGAIASGGLRVLNDDVLRDLRLPASAIDAVEQRERTELERRERAYRGDRPMPDLRGKTVIVVDDGLATGATMRAALGAIRRQAPAWLVAAAPVAAPSVREMLRDVADDIVLVAAPSPFYAVGAWYGSFPPTTDDEVRDALARSLAAGASPAA
ncbi:MAG: phosphoribosyltransferase [Thermomicrobiales bacterium]